MDVDVAVDITTSDVVLVVDAMVEHMVMGLQDVVSVLEFSTLA